MDVSVRLSWKPYLSLLDLPVFTILSPCLHAADEYGHANNAWHCAHHPATTIWAESAWHDFDEAYFHLVNKVCMQVGVYVVNKVCMWWVQGVNKVCMWVGLGRRVCLEGGLPSGQQDVYVGGFREKIVFGGGGLRTRRLS